MRTLILAISLVAFGAGLAATVNASSEPKGIYLHVTNGARVKTRRKNSVYMIDCGILRHVHYAAYKRLWEGWGGIALVNEIPESSIGEPIRGTSRLVQVSGERAVWFIDNDRVRRWVPSFYPPKFSRKKVEKITREALLEYEEGPHLE